MRTFDVLSGPNNQITKKSWFGGVLSLICFLALFLLLRMEYLNWAEKKLTKTIYVDNRTRVENVLVTLSILMPNIPCSIISLDVHDNLQHHRENIEIQKFKIKNDINHISLVF